MSNRFVLVVGMHRSGTSAVCRLLEHSGVGFGSNLIPPSDDNPLGFWEDRELVRLNDQILGDHGAWMQISLPKFEPADDWSRAAVSFVQSKAGSVGSESDYIGLKDPRLCRTISYWLPLLEDIKVVFVVRNPMAVARSLNKRDGITTDYALALWFVYNYEALRSLQNADAPFRIANYDRLMSSDTAEIAGIQSHLHLRELDTSALEKNLQHQKPENLEINTDDFILNIANKLWSEIISGAPQWRDFEFNYNKILAIYAPFRKLSAQIFDIETYASHLEKDIGILRRRLSTLEEEKAECKGYVAHVEKDLSELRKEVTERDSSISSLKALLSDNEEAARKIKAELSQSLEENERLKIDYQALSEQYEQLEVVRWQVDEILYNVYQSRSWKITAPLRSIRRQVSSFIRRLLMPLRWVASLVLRKLSNVKARAFISSRQNSRALQAMVDARRNLVPWQNNTSPDFDELPIIGLSVVLYNNGHWLETFLKSLDAQSYPLQRIRVIFIDNSSTDNTPYQLECLKRDYAGVFNSLEVVTRPNSGFGSGHDYAIRSLEVDYVLVSNVDLEFEKDSIVTAVTTALLDGNSASWEFRQSPYEHPKFVDPVTLQVNWSSHACILLDRQAYLLVGGYEKRIFMYGEDVELSYRLRRQGYGLRYVPRSVVFHHTYESKGEVKLLQYTGSTIANLFIRCRYGNVTDIITGYFLILALALKGAGFRHSRRKIFRSLPMAFLKSVAFIATRKKSSAHFPFRGFDYDLCREGAFWESSREVIDGTADLPLITVITRTVSGREALLTQAVTSVMNQTYPEIEHIIAEDGGHSAEDFCERIAQSRIGSYQIRHKACEKKGRSHAANQALQISAGEYVIFLDDDDLFFPDHLETLMTEIIRTGVDAAYSLAWDTPVLFTDKARSRYLEHAHVTLSLFKQEFDRKVLFHHNFLPIQSVLFSRKLLRGSKGFDEDLDYLEDWVFWKRISKGANFKFVHKTTSQYKTPLSTVEDFRRRRLLDEAYAVAKSRPEN